MSKRSILIVENEQAIRESLSLFLAGEGFECRVARNTQEAIERMREHSFDTILLDLQKSRSDGFKTLHYVNLHHPESAVIIITSYGRIEEAAPALKQGASKILLKPIDFEELLETINALVPGA